MMIILGQRAVQAEDIALGEQFIQPNHLDAVGQFAWGPVVVRNHAHTKRPGQGGRLPADQPKADDAKSLPL